MIRVILTDIEGTTSSLSFVKDVLFPYARSRLADYIHQHHEQPEVRACLDDVCREAGRQLDTAGIIAQLQQWIDEDRKVTPLKQLQGLIWEEGYTRGDFHGHIYEDALEAIRAWHAAGIPVYIYSSGSVHAQKLLFAHTAYGDLTPLLNGYFDTTIGAKVETESYRRIADVIGVAAGEILFLSDVERELDAARDAGCRTCWLVRDGTVGPQASHLQVRDFSSIRLD